MRTVKFSIYLIDSQYCLSLFEVDFIEVSIRTCATIISVYLISSACFSQYNSAAFSIMSWILS